LGATITNHDGMLRLFGSLNLARSVGDHHLKKYVTCSPFIQRIHISNIKYIVMASDGIWDVMNAEEIHNELVATIGNGTDAIRNVLNKIIHIAKQKGSTDNITITYVEF
jgi:serine/threonine protein phosphatase PrpC